MAIMRTNDPDRWNHDRPTETAPTRSVPTPRGEWGGIHPFANGPLLSIPEAAAVLNISEAALRKQVSAQKVPFTRLGRQVRFGAHHMAAIVAAGEQEILEPEQDQGDPGADESVRTLPQTSAARSRGGRRRSTL